MKIDISESYSHGQWTLTFRKRFDLPFIPVIGMSLLDRVGSHEVEIELDKKTTIIQYDIKTGTVRIYNYNYWENPVTREVVERIMETFTHTGWIRTDASNFESYYKYCEDRFGKP